MKAKKELMEMFRDGFGLDEFDMVEWFFEDDEECDYLFEIISKFLEQDVAEYINAGKYDDAFDLLSYAWFVVKVFALRSPKYKRNDYLNPIKQFIDKLEEKVDSDVYSRIAEWKNSLNEQKKCYVKEIIYKDICYGRLVDNHKKIVVLAENNKVMVGFELSPEIYKKPRLKIKNHLLNDCVVTYPHWAECEEESPFPEYCKEYGIPSEYVEYLDLYDEASTVE